MTSPTQADRADGADPTPDAAAPAAATTLPDAGPANLPLAPDAPTAEVGGVTVLGAVPGAALGDALPANRDQPPAGALRITADTQPVERGEAALWGAVRWRTLFCADRTPTAGMVMGIAEFGPGEALKPHRHAPAEMYFGLDGAGVVTVAGVAHAIGPGVALYIPGEAEHGTVAGPEGLRFLYAFPTARFSEVDYRFAAD